MREFRCDERESLTANACFTRLETTAPKTTNDFWSQTLAARSGDGENLAEFGLSSDGIVTGSADQQTYVYLGNGDGSFTIASNFPGAGPGLAVAHLNPTLEQRKTSNR